jgi:uncharacterized protein
VEHPNLAIMQRTLEAFRVGDIPALGQLFAENIVWRVPGRSDLGKDYRGQTEVFGFFGQLMQLTSGTFRVESIDMFANDSGGVFVDRLTAERDGRRLDVKLMLNVMIRDGKIVEGTDYFHQEHLWDAFWS